MRRIGWWVALTALVAGSGTAAGKGFEFSVRLGSTAPGVPTTLRVHVAYPDDPAAMTDEEWAHYVFFRANPKGMFAERWCHSVGCRRWFNAVRDTATYRFHGVYRVGEPKPVIS